VSDTYLAFDLGAESGRAMLGTLQGGTLDLREIRRFPNEPVRQNGSLYWDVLRLWHEVTTTRSSASAATCSRTRITIATSATKG